MWAVEKASLVTPCVGTSLSLHLEGQLCSPGNELLSLLGLGLPLGPARCQICFSQGCAFPEPLLPRAKEQPPAQQLLLCCQCLLPFQGKSLRAISVFSEQFHSSDKHTPTLKGPMANISLTSLCVHPNSDSLEPRL